MGETNRARLVSKLRVFERAHVDGDGTGLFAARERDATVETPQRRKLRVGDTLTERVRWTAKRRCGLNQVILEEPGGGQGSADGELVFTAKRAAAQEREEQLCGFATAATLERGVRAGEVG